MHQRLARLMIVTAIPLLAPVSASAQEIVTPPLAGAQEVTALPLAGPRIDQVQVFRVVSPELGLAGATLQAVDRKDPLVAGILSWLIPGLGSFYAGNSGHGVRHLVIAVGGYALLVAGAASDDCLYGDSCGLLYAGAGVIVVNAVWGIVTAVGDANAHNRGAGAARPGRVVGSLYVEPNIVGLSKQSAPSQALRPVQSSGLQLLRVEF